MRDHIQRGSLDLTSVRAVVFGMGRIGSGAYDELATVYGRDICGVEHAPERVDLNRAQGRNVILGDACDTEVCINGVVSALNAYVNSLSISSSRKRAITRRLDLAAYKFCIGASTSTVIDALNNVVSYVAYHSGSGIPASDADYIIGQINALIASLNAGIVVCCTPSIPHPANPGVATTADALQLQANPNPFRDEVAIRFSLPQAGPATLELFNLNGQRVAALHSGYLDAGQQDFRWNGADGSGQQLSSGIYLVRSQMEDATLTQKVSMVR